MGFKLVTGMPEQPNTCLTCGTNPVNDDGTQKKAVFAEGVDVDWGNSVYLCEECANIIADLMHRVPREFSDKVEKELEELKAAHMELAHEYERQEELIEKIRDGAAAKKALREEAVATS